LPVEEVQEAVLENSTASFPHHMINIRAIPWVLYIRYGIGGILIAAGFAALVTPLTPGSWLIPLGIAVIIGKPRAFAWSIRVLGQRLHDLLRVEKILHFFIRDKKK